MVNKKISQNLSWERRAITVITGILGGIIGGHFGAQNGHPILGGFIGGFTLCFIVHLFIDSISD